MLRLIRASEYREQRWKNGGGLTHEIAATDFWRVSIATIERSGPFSDYRGYDRTIVAIEGELVTLLAGDETIVLRHFEPLEFPGEEKVEARVNGLARDLNVMTFRDRFAHDVEIVEGRQRFVLDEDEFAFVYAIDGDATVGGTALSCGDTLHVTGAEALDVDAALHAAVVRITALV
jgi:uncharacterized protein